MCIFFFSDQSSAVVAWYGAIVATIVGGYQIYRLWASERTSFTVRIFKSWAGSPDTQYWETINVELINVGKATTLKRVTLEFKLNDEEVESDFRSSNFDLNLARPFPTHDIWFGTSEYDLSEELPKLNGSNSKICVYHSSSKKPKRFPFEIESDHA